MKQTQLIMGMPITVEIIGDAAIKEASDEVFSFFQKVDEQFSTYKKNSEISRFNNKLIRKEQLSDEMKYIFNLSEMTKKETNGYFNIERNGFIDPSGMVKGWAIQEAANLLRKKGFTDFYIDAGGDIQTAGEKNGKPWTVGIRNPFDREKHIKVLSLSGEAIATSGSAIRGQHIYNPHSIKPVDDIISVTVIGRTILDADRYATAAFAMGKDGITFIERLPGFEGYMIDKDGIATETTGFHKFVN